MTLATVLKSLETSGCTVPEIDLLQPADPFLDTAGEDLRRRIFITQENSGKTLCLRPEFTIPVCLQHLENGWFKARYAYGGKVFRQRNDDRVEFTQAGCENLGSKDTKSADIDCIQTAITALRSVVQNELSLMLGDKAIFASALDALRIPEAWNKKLIRSFGDQDLLAGNLNSMSNANTDNMDELPDEVRNALESRDFGAVTNVLSGQMTEAGLPLSGGRTPEAIARRMIEKAELSSQKLDMDAKSALEAFLQIDVPLADAADSIADFEDKFGILLPFAKEELSGKYEGLKNSGLEMRYRAGFGRRLDYYTGFVFEIYSENQIKPVAGGGRYDRLLTLLGSPEEIPAVGFSIWVDRLEGAAWV